MSDEHILHLEIEEESRIVKKVKVVGADGKVVGVLPATKVEWSAQVGSSAVVSVSVHARVISGT